MILNLKLITSLLLIYGGLVIKVGAVSFDQTTGESASGFVGTLGVANGGTGSTSFISGQVIVGNGTSGLTSAAPTIVDAYNASFGAVTSGSTSTLTWTEVTDRNTEFVTSSFTVTTAGFYEITVDGGASQTAGTGCFLIKNNSTTIAGGTACITGATALATVLTVSVGRVLNLAANDIIRVDASATSANVTFQTLHLTIKRIL